MRQSSLEMLQCVGGSFGNVALAKLIQEDAFDMQLPVSGLDIATSAIVRGGMATFASNSEE